MWFRNEMTTGIYCKGKNLHGMGHLLLFFPPRTPLEQDH